MELLGDGVMWNLVSVRLEMVLVSVQDRFMVCAKRTIGPEIILDALMVLLGDEAHVVARFDPFGDSANLDVDRCTVYDRRRNRLDARDGTPT